MTQSSNSSGTSSSAQRRWTQLPFLTAVIILAAAAGILNLLNVNLGLHFKKEAVPQPRDFHDLPVVFGKWIQISQDAKLDPETEDVLGTQQYVYRDYIRVDQHGADLLVYLNDQTAKAGGKPPSSTDDADMQIRHDFDTANFDQRVTMIQAAMKDKTPAESTATVRFLQTLKDAAVVDMGLTYYTGLVDTVAHIPDRCYIADGYEPSSPPATPSWDMGNGNKLDVRFIAFDDVTGSNRVPKCVAYVFHTNGHYESDSIGVRRTLENLTERYGYYAKIELMSIVSDVRNTDAAQTAMADFLASAKPQVETCFPDWQKLHENTAK